MRETGDYKHLLVLALALMFGLIGFADDFIKVKKKRNLGLTGPAEARSAGAGGLPVPCRHAFYECPDV